MMEFIWIVFKKKLLNIPIETVYLILHQDVLLNGGFLYTEDVL